MTISVEIADRLYDYTDEEKAAEAVASFQDDNALSDEALLALWQGSQSPMRDRLEKCIFEAVDANGSSTRAQNSIPNGITLAVDARADS